MNLPKTRTSDIIEQEAGGELLIYDLQTDKAYTLNETLKIVYEACGKMTFEELKRKHKFTHDLIYFALAELAANNLIENYQSDHFAGLSRREAIRRVGLASLVALPVIAGLIAPKAAQAASGTCAAGQICNNATPCTAPCTSCNGAGTCATAAGTGSCSVIGSTCSVTATGTCLGVTYTCSAPGGICTGPGGCFGINGDFGICNLATPGTCSPGGTTCFSSGPCTSLGFGTCTGTGTCA